MNREQAEQEVFQLVDTWTKAELRGDVAALEKVLVDDFVGVGPLGFMLTRPEWLARHETGELKYTAHTFDQARVRLYDDAAIVIGRLTQQATYRGSPVNAQLRTTLMFVHQDGQWRLAGLQFSAMGQFHPPVPAQS